MRGGPIHNHVLLDPVDREFKAVGAYTHREMTVRFGKQIGYVDLYAELDSHRICVEAELSAKRIANDLKKAMAANATALWIIVPNVQVRRAVQRQLKRLHLRSNDGIFVLSLCQALERIRNCFPLISGANDSRKANQGDRRGN